MSTCDHVDSLNELDEAIQKFVAESSPVEGTKVLAHWVLVIGEEIVDGEHTGHSIGVTTKPHQPEYASIGLLSVGANVIGAGPSRMVITNGDD